VIGWVAAILGLFVLAEVAANWWAVRIVLSMIDAAPPFQPAACPATEEGRPVCFETSDGLTLRGRLYQHDDFPPRGLIVFCHELGAAHWSALWYARGLWDAGFDVLAFDFRNHGQSDSLPGYRPLHWLTWYEVQDVRAAIRFAERDERLRTLPLGLFGISRGGGAALVAAAVEPRVLAVACEGAFAMEDVVWHHSQRWFTLYADPRILSWIPNWHVKLTMRLACWVSQFRRRCRYPSMRRLLWRLRNRPVLLISGADDSYVLPEIARELLAKTGHGDEALWVVPGAKHNRAREVAGEEYDRRLCQFFDTAFKAVPDQSVTETAGV